MKKLFKRIISVLLSFVIFVSMFSCCFGQAFVEEKNKDEAVQSMLSKIKPLMETIQVDKTVTDEVSTEGLGEFSVLVSLLLDEGQYSADSDTCTFIDDYEINGKNIVFMITWDLPKDMLYCGAKIDDSMMAIMILDSNQLDGYLLGPVYTEGSLEVYGTEWVLPGNYPYEIDFMMFDENGDYHNFSNSFENELNDKFNDATKILIENINTLMEDCTGMNLGNFGFTKMFEPKDYIVTTTRGDIVYDANGGTNVPAPQIKKYEKPLTLTNDVPIRSGYRFLGWSLNPKSTTPSYFPGDVFTLEGDTTLYAIWTKVSSNDGSENVADPVIRIVNNPGTLTVNRYTSVVLSVETENMPDGAYVAWFANGKQINFVASGTLTVNCNDVCDCVVEIKLCDKDGNIILDSNGNEIGDSETIVTKGGFFVTIIGFFKKLFGLNEYIQ